jgi:carnitine 3-dehydrogenase
VLPEWVDYNGHMTEFRYLHVFGDATDAFLTHIGMDSAYMARGRSVYTVESHIRHVQEVAAGKGLVLETQLLGHDEKRIRISHVMREAETGEVLATGEHMLLSVDTQAGRATPLEAPIPARLAPIAAGHDALDAPDFAGRAIRAL